MLLVIAAMGEELDLALALFPDRQKLSGRGSSYWRTRRREKPIGFFRTGVGPRRSAANLGRILDELTPSRILAIGYAGALDPSLELGDLVVVRRALACSLDKNMPGLGHLKLDGRYDLRDADTIAEAANSQDLRACTGDTLTSAYVLGAPEHKRLLYEKYHASIVDMETAAVASLAESRNIRFSCIRAISDEAEDTFLAPFSYDPSTGPAARAVKIFSTGIQSYQKWKGHARIAGESMRRFLSYYLYL